MSTNNPWVADLVTHLDQEGHGWAKKIMGAECDLLIKNDLILLAKTQGEKPSLTMILEAPNMKVMKQEMDAAFVRDQQDAGQQGNANQLEAVAVCPSAVEVAEPLQLLLSDRDKAIGLVVSKAAFHMVSKFKFLVVDPQLSGVEVAQIVAKANCDITGTLGSRTNVRMLCADQSSENHKSLGGFHLMLARAQHHDAKGLRWA